VRKLLILRPQPGASETATKAAGLRLDVVVAPLFTVRPVAWEAPGEVDAILLTSANAARQTGADLGPLAGKPCYVTGEATAAAARQAGFGEVRAGSGDGAAALRLAREDGHRRVLHLCGRDHIVFPDVEQRIVYAADAVPALPDAARDAVAEGAIALLHSPRAAALFRTLVDDPTGIAIAALSPAVADAAGEGWAAVAVAPQPRDEALLEVAAKLCQTAASSNAEAGR
jgi:uroporphyrinogen-III synthase